MIGHDGNWNSVRSVTKSCSAQSIAPAMSADSELLHLMRAIAATDHSAVAYQISRTPEIAIAALTAGGVRGNSESFFLDDIRMQLYAGDTALHVAAWAYDEVTIRRLVELGAGVRATNRRRAQPLHAATSGSPETPHWNPDQQCATIRLLVEFGADIEATAMGGVTALHRAVRNRCSMAVATLLTLGADPLRPNDNGSTPLELANWTTGRGGTGSAASKVEQQEILRLLSHFTNNTMA